MPRLAPSELLAEVEALASDPPEDLLADAGLRLQLYRALGAAKLSVEPPFDLVHRVLSAQATESSLIKVALDLELFQKLKDGDPKSIAELADLCKVDLILLKRLLRALATFGAVKELGEDTYSLPRSHAVLADAEYASAVRICADIMQPTYLGLSQFLKDSNFRNPIDPKNTTVQSVHGFAGQDLMSYMIAEKPEWAHAFGMLMTRWNEGRALVHNLYPVKEKLIDTYEADISPIFFVDVGGGYGQKSIDLKNAIPDLPGRMIVQDQPVFIEKAPTVEGIEFMIHDIFKEQPIKNAKTYYIRQVLHDFTDEDCVKILSNLRPALKSGYSKLLIHELVVSEVDASLWMTTQDINMMTLTGAKERSMQMWKTLIEDAGLSIENVFLSTDGVSESVLEVVSE